MERKLDPVGTAALMAEMACMVAVPILLRFLATHVDVWWVNTLRFGTALVFWLPLVLRRAARGRLHPAVWRKALAPLAANVSQQVMFAAAIYFIQPAFFSLLLKSSVIWIIGLSMIVFPDERALARSPRLWIGLVLCLGGILGVTVGREDFAARGTLTGVLLALGAAASWAAYTVIARRVFADIDSREAFGVLSIYTTAVLAGLALLFGDFSGVRSLEPKAWVAVVASAILGIALGHVLYYTAVKRLGGTICALVGLASPFLVLAVSFLVFGETLTDLQWVFGMVLIAGAGLVLWSQQHLGARRGPRKRTRRAAPLAGPDGASG